MKQRDTHKLLDRLIVISITLWMLLATAAIVRADRVQLRDRAQVTQSQVYLADVANLSGDQYDALKTVPVASVPDHTDSIKVTLDQVRSALEDQKFNTALMTIGGFRTCQVVLDRPAPPTPPAPEAAAAETSPDTPLDALRPNTFAANPIDAVSIENGLTVREQLVDYLERYTGYEREKLEITFSDQSRDIELLKRPVGTDRLSFEVGSQARLGRLALTINQYRGDEKINTDRLVVRVALKLEAVTVTQLVSRGQTYTPDVLAVRPVVIDREGDVPLSDPDKVIGQVASNRMLAGSSVMPDDIQAPILVKRGELIYVRAISGGLVMRIMCRAREQGSKGQWIRVENTGSGEEFQAQVTDRRQAVLRTGDLDAQNSEVN